MNLATLRVEGPDSSLAAVKQILALACDAEWTKGEIARNGRARGSSGFNATVADADSPRELIEKLRAFLTHCKEKGVVFPGYNLIAELAVGFTVGDSEQFVACVEFSPSDLLCCAECGITLSVTSYPTSDEANTDGYVT